MSVIAVWSRSRPAPRHARAQRRMAAFASAVVAGLLVWALVYALTPYRLWFNLVSDSLPGFVYLVELGTLPAQRGDAIVFRPPPNRFYPTGLKFAKLAMGLPGDVISRDAQDRRVFVNSAFFGDLRTTSSLGALQPGPIGVVPPDHYWVWTCHPLSLDSRYADIGYIPRDRVLGRAVRLL